VDEPIREVAVSGEADVRSVRLANYPFQGGYPDFIPYSTIEEATQAPNPPRSSMFDDLYHYYENHSTRLQITAIPSSAVFFLPKIVASHHVLLLEYIRGLLNYLERLLLAHGNLGSSVLDRKTEDLWTNIHLWSRRCHNYQVTLDENMTQLQVHHRFRTKDTDESVIEDFRSLQEQFRDLRSQATSLVGSMISISTLLDNKRNMNESRSVSRLTILGAVFLPLSFTTGLFSMGADYLPGAPKFRLYWAVALSIIAALFAIPFLVGWLIHIARAQKERPKFARLAYTVPDIIPT
jgi:CorA-like Mg2+ transporter protein